MTDHTIKVDKESLNKFIKETFVCYNCKKPTGRYIKFMTSLGIVSEFECINCRQERVQKQVDDGLRPASDLEPENLPENRKPL